MPDKFSVDRRTILRGIVSLPVVSFSLASPIFCSEASARSVEGSINSVSSTGGSVQVGDLTDSYAPDWMGRLPDSTKLSALSIPGSHDSMSNGASVFAATQDNDLASQLLAGIRAIDIRCRHFRDRFSIHHDIEYLNANFSDVVRVVSNFLGDNPSEIILMRLKEESTAAENSRSFEATLDWYINENPETCDLLEVFLWNPPDGYVGDFPNLGDSRGKIIVLQDFSSDNPRGPKWGGGDMVIQDEFALADLAAISTKWGHAFEHFERSRVTDFQKIFVNHISAAPENPAAWARAVFPVTVARGYLGEAGMVTRTVQYLQESKYGRTGVVMADFPTAKLVKSVISRNFN